MNREQIEVTFRTNTNGKVTPTSFTRQGEIYQVESVGRRWLDDDGQHILVITLPDNRAWEVLYNPDDESWLLIRGHDRPTVRRA